MTFSDAIVIEIGMSSIALAIGVILERRGFRRPLRDGRVDECPLIDRRRRTRIREVSRGARPRPRSFDNLGDVVAAVALLRSPLASSSSHSSTASGQQAVPRDSLTPAGKRGKVYDSITSTIEVVGLTKRAVGRSEKNSTRKRSPIATKPSACNRRAEAYNARGRAWRKKENTTRPWPLYGSHPTQAKICSRLQQSGTPLKRRENRQGSRRPDRGDPTRSKAPIAYTIEAPSGPSSGTRQKLSATATRPSD